MQTVAMLADCLAARKESKWAGTKERLSDVSKVGTKAAKTAQTRVVLTAVLMAEPKAGLTEL